MDVGEHGRTFLEWWQQGSGDWNRQGSLGQHASSLGKKEGTITQPSTKNVQRQRRLGGITSGTWSSRRHPGYKRRARSTRPSVRRPGEGASPGECRRVNRTPG